MSAAIRPGLGPRKGSNNDAHETRIAIASDLDIIRARQTGRTEAARLGFSSTDLTLIATAISELARNIVMYAKEGEIVVRIVRSGEKQGIVVIARDKNDLQSMQTFSIRREDDGAIGKKQTRVQ